MGYQHNPEQIPVPRPIACVFCAQGPGCPEHPPKVTLPGWLSPESEKVLFPDA